LIEVTGNFFDYAQSNGIHALVCTINQVTTKTGRLVMGAGIAKAFRDRYRDLDLEWGGLTRFGKSGLLVSWNYMPSLVIGLPTKTDWKLPSDKRLIKRSLAELKELVEEYNIDRVLLTRPGCGNGGFKWPEILPLFKNFDDRFVIISP